VQTIIVCTWSSQWFSTKKIILFFKNNLTRINHCKLIHHKSHLKPFLSYLPCIVCIEYFRIIFNVKKCALYLIKYNIVLSNLTIDLRMMSGMLDYCAIAAAQLTSTCRGTTSDNTMVYNELNSPTARVLITTLHFILKLRVGSIN
jgi:hypothetical protein